MGKIAQTIIHINIYIYISNKTIPSTYGENCGVLSCFEEKNECTMPEQNIRFFSIK